MIFIHGIDDPNTVKALRDSIDAMLLRGTMPIEYVVQGNNFRSALLVTPQNIQQIRDDCTDFLIGELLGEPNTGRSGTFFN